MGSSESTNNFPFLNDTVNPNEQLTIFTQLELYEIKSNSILEKTKKKHPDTEKEAKIITYNSEISFLKSKCVFNVTTLEKLKENKKNIENILDKMLLL